VDKIGGAPVGRPQVGRAIRRWRTERGMTLSAVAAASGLNLGYLSQIENDKASPSLDALAAIAGALDVRIAWFLQDDAPAPRVVRIAERPAFESPVTGGAVGTLVDGGQARDVRIVEAATPPGHRTGLHAHAGEEHHVVVAGRWRMTQGEHVVDLEPGDYLSWDASVPHDVECLEGDPGRILIIYRRRAG
jgi:mannose-6-phosphate isomerase-like protein (cupin superfamily)